MIQTQLPYLYYFFLVAKHKSFTRAAQELSISQSAVSMQIKKLEGNLEISLFLRQARNQVELTNEGQTLFKTCRDIFEELNQTFEIMTDQEIAGDLAVNSSVLFGSFIMVPFIKKFRQAYPKIKVELQLTDDYIDLQKENVDLVIRWGTKRDAKLKFIPLMEQKSVPVASVNYLKKYPKLIHPKQLSDHVMITWTPENLDWNRWLKTVPKKDWPVFRDILPMQNVIAQAEAIKEDMGVALMPIYTVVDLIRKKQVKVLFPNIRPHFYPAYICYLKADYVSQKKKVFVKMLKEFVDGLPMDRK